MTLNTGINKPKRTVGCFCFILITKGQLISKGHFGFSNSLKRRAKNFCSSRLGQNLSFQVCFWENWRHRKDISKLTDLYIEQKRIRKTL